MAAMSGQGSTANVIAAIASFFIPGLGQLVQGRLLAAAVQFVLAAGGVKRAASTIDQMCTIHPPHHPQGRGARPCRLIFRAQVQ